MNATNTLKKEIAIFCTVPVCVCVCVHVLRVFVCVHFVSMSKFSLDARAFVLWFFDCWRERIHNIVVVGDVEVNSLFDRIMKMVDS